ncbi:MAG: hypothetical protein IT317_10275 [Anaerolineales bacterium]|nr:hypothetical protein [Anaerolineales bacterium]
MESQSPSAPRSRSLFFPIVLIGVGAIWLLVNFNIIQGFTFGQVFRLWPLFLIAVGLELLFGRARAFVGALIGLLTVAALIVLLIYGRQLGLSPIASLKTKSFSAPLAGAARAQVMLDLDAYATTLGPTAHAENLVEADLTYTSEAIFDVSGTTDKAVTVGVRNDNMDPFAFFDSIDARWRIGLSPDVPLGLTVDGGSGLADLDLQALNLTGLAVDGGSGSVHLRLPASGGYTAEVSGGSGSVQIEFVSGAQATLRYDGGSGALMVNVPDGQAVRVEIRDSGSGGVSLPSGWEVVSDGDNDEGVWQTPGYAAAADQLLIIVTAVGSGSIRVD